MALLQFTQTHVDPDTGQRYPGGALAPVTDSDERTRILAVAPRVAYDQTSVFLAPQLRVAAVGGTANAVTLTTGTGLTSLPAGLRLRVRFTSANTGAMTINVDGLGAVDAKTPILTDPVAGFIRTGFDHVIEYDGTRWIVFRLVQNIVNSNGRAVLFEDGTMIAANRLTRSVAIDSAYGDLFISSGASLDFPATFSAAPTVTAGEGERDGASWVNAYNVSTTGCTLRGYDAVSRTATDTTYSYQAIGRWF